MEFNISDPKNIIGVSSLLDRGGEDFIELEKEITNGKIDIKEEEHALAQQYNKEMERLSNDYEIDTFTFGTDNKQEEQHQPPIDDILNDLGQQHDFTDFNYMTESSKDSRKIEQLTIEQQKKKHLDFVLDDIIKDNSLGIDIDKEREEDDKNILLEQIDSLRRTLTQDGEDLQNIPIVSKDSNITDIRNIYKILSLKCDRNRYCSMADELILSGALGMEYLFNGEREWFGKKPDLVGWSKTVSVKLRKSRYQTSTFVRDIMHEYNFSSGSLLMMELLLSMFLYSNKKQKSNANFEKNNFQYEEACRNLNSL